MAAAGGVLLDSDLLVGEDAGGNPCLCSGAASLLRRLKYSNLRVGISLHEAILPQKATFLERTAVLYSCDCIRLSLSHVNNLPSTWGVSGATCFYLTSGQNEELIAESQKNGWQIVYQGICNLPSMKNEVVLINKLDELLFLLCAFNKKAMGDNSVIVVGYVMKPSREEDFAKRGAFPLCPTQNGLMFVPLTFELPLEAQLRAVDVVLLKATDEIRSIDSRSSIEFPKGISYSSGMSELERYFQNHSDCCIIDPLTNIYPLLDRLKMQEILLGLEDIKIKGHPKVRAPHFVKVDNFQEVDLREQILESKLCFPAILKPQVACGIDEAHNMALVFKLEDFKDLRVPLPAIMQEYVNHGSLLFKFYVLGHKVFHAVKKSMPNANSLMSSSERSGFAPLEFNSLKSLPIAKEDQPSEGVLKVNEQSLDVNLVNQAANWLRRKLGLTIFGFDVVIQEETGDHVIVDLNYLPSFKEVPDGDAIPAFWDAIKNAYGIWKANCVTKFSD